MHQDARYLEPLEDYSNTLQSLMDETTDTFLAGFHVDTVAVTGHLLGVSEDDLAAALGRSLRISAEGDLLSCRVLPGCLPGTWSSSLHVLPVRNHPAGVVVRIEGSVQKFILGQNVRGGSADLPGIVRFLERVPEMLSLPSLRSSWLSRVDLACNLSAGSEEAARKAAQALFLGISRSSSHRRQPALYGTSVQAGGTKLYLKLPELLAHPPAMARHEDQPGCSPSSFEALRQAAGPILRFETRFNGRDLVRLSRYGCLTVEADDVAPETRGDGVRRVSCCDVDLSALFSTAVRRLVRFMRLSDSEQFQAVEECYSLLSARYGPELGLRLFHAWQDLVTRGERAYRSSVSKPTYYRHLAQLRDCGVSWRGVDIQFSPSYSLSVVPLVTDPELACALRYVA